MFMKEKLRQGIARFRSNEYLYLILAFLIPVTVMYVIYVFMSVWPFGKYSCMALDLNGQYVYYFEKLRDVLTQGGSLLYSCILPGKPAFLDRLPGSQGNDDGGDFVLAAAQDGA